MTETLLEEVNPNGNVLWFVPISEEERQVAINQGSERLKPRLPVDRWKQA
jgi:hypothetical protein